MNKEWSILLPEWTSSSATVSSRIQMNEYFLWPLFTCYGSCTKDPVMVLKLGKKHCRPVMQNVLGSELVKNDSA